MRQHEYGRIFLSVLPTVLPLVERNPSLRKTRSSCTPPVPPPGVLHQPSHSRLYKPLRGEQHSRQRLKLPAFPVAAAAAAAAAAAPVAFHTVAAAAPPPQADSSLIAMRRAGVISAVASVLLAVDETTAFLPSVARRQRVARRADTVHMGYVSEKKSVTPFPPPPFYSSDCQQTRTHSPPLPIMDPFLFSSPPTGSKSTRGTTRMACRTRS